MPKFGDYALASSLDGSEEFVAKKSTSTQRINLNQIKSYVNENLEVPAIQAIPGSIQSYSVDVDLASVGLGSFFTIINPPSNSYWVPIRIIMIPLEVNPTDPMKQIGLNLYWYNFLRNLVQGNITNPTVPQDETKILRDDSDILTREGEASLETTPFIGVNGVDPDPFGEKIYSGFDVEVKIVSWDLIGRLATYSGANEASYDDTNVKSKYSYLLKEGFGIRGLVSNAMTYSKFLARFVVQFESLSF